MPIRTGLRTPLALAVLNLLFERPMHPYEMQRLMRERGHDDVIKLKHGSLYATIERLAAAGLIQSGETSREGRRPERTVYAITEIGVDELLLWMRDLLASPTHEFPWFGSVLAFVGALPPQDVESLLRARAMRLQAEIARMRSMLDGMKEHGVPRLFGIEGEYLCAMHEAELQWVQHTADEIKSGTLEWPADVLAFHEEMKEGRDTGSPE